MSDSSKAELMDPPGAPSEAGHVALWQQVLDRLRPIVSESTYRIYLEPIQASALDSNALVLAAPPSRRKWVADRFSSVIAEMAASIVGRQLLVVFVDRQKAASLGVDADQLSSDSRSKSGHLNPSLTFDRFVIGAGNHLAHAASLTVAELPSQAYNPLFLFGPTGVGKTHLLHATANYVSTFSPQLNAIYTTLESFTNEFVSALRGGSISMFKKRFRNLDILLIDDVHFLEGKEQTQEEFFHTFNALHDLGSQIVLTSDRPPQEIALLHARLQSRFSLGLSVDIEPPNLATRLAILQKRVSEEKIAVTDPDLLDFIARNVPANIRALEGALIRTVAYASLANRPLTLGLAQKVVTNLYNGSATSLGVDSVLLAVCDEFGITETELLSNSRLKSVTYPRHIAMYLSRKLTDLSLPKLARAFKRSDHTTVMNATRKIEAMGLRDAKTRDLLTRLERTLRPVHKSTGLTKTSPKQTI